MPSLPMGFLSFQRRGKSFRRHTRDHMSSHSHSNLSAFHETSPSTMAMASGAPQEPLVVKLETTTVNVMSSYSEWLTLGLPIDLCIPPPTKLLGNRSQHVCLLCGDVKMSSNGAYNHIWTEHVGVLLQCCFCSWNSGSAHMM